MVEESLDKNRQSISADSESAEFGSNDIRLSVKEWVAVVVIVVTAIVVLPNLWTRIEPFDPSADYRIPYDLSEDYWLFSRLIEKDVETNRIVVIGDSVMWGEYVTPQQTLTHFLNEQDQSSRFANGGVNGTHPLALEGLVRHYAADVTDSPVILHCNLLWMSSPERDLQTEKEVSFNHPALVPQFTPRIPSYTAKTRDRLDVVVHRASRFRGLVKHVRIAYFDRLDLNNWSIEHPYENPLRRITLKLPEPSDQPHSRPMTWTERGIEEQEIPWVDLETSLQWRAFRDTVKLLEARRNRVFVVVGPFNEHMLMDSSRLRYRERKRFVEQWLQDNTVPYYAPNPLPSHEYADASHPLRDGYARLAQSIYSSDEFTNWLSDR